jgi:uncharacterized protein (DUF111 family)
MRIAYFDCSWGISGDSLLGALLDVGLSLDALRRGLSQLPLCGFQTVAEKVVIHGVEGTRVSVLADEHGSTSSHDMQGRTSRNGSAPSAEVVQCPPNPVEAVCNSSLPSIVKGTAGAALRRLTQSGGEICACEHGCTLQYEVCKTERLVTSVGVALGLSLLGIDRVECSPLNAGSGFVETDRGLLPGLAPCTAEILRAASAPVYGGVGNKELVTASGAAIITTVSSRFGSMPTMRIERMGYGVGRERSSGEPGLLRLIVGERVAEGAEADPVLQAQAKISPETTPQDTWREISLAYRLSEGHQQSGRQSKVMDFEL